MGVKGCSRLNCESIMCDHYSYVHGFICKDCLEELVNSDCRDIQEFMNTPKKIIGFSDQDAWGRYVYETFHL